MKTTTFIFSALLIATSAIAQVNLQQGLIAYYPLNNSPLDSTANNLDLTIFGAPIGVVNRFNVNNAAYSFNSSTPDYLIGPASSLFAPAAVTLSAWVWLTNAMNDQKIVGKATVGSGYLMGVDSNKIDAEIWDMNAIHYRLKSETVPTGAWTHIAMSYLAGDYLRVYINGQVRDSMSSGVGIGTSSNWPFTVAGAPWQPVALNVNGKIDDIFVYNRALNNAEIDALYNQVTSIDEYLFSNMTIYPVPAHNGYINVQFKENVKGNVYIYVCNGMGQNVYSKTFVNPLNANIDLHNLKSGIYSISFVNDARKETHKIIIE